MLTHRQWDKLVYYLTETSLPKIVCCAGLLFSRTGIQYTQLYSTNWSYLLSLKSPLENGRIKVIANDEIPCYLVIYWIFIIQITCRIDTQCIQLIRFICVWENENFFALINSKCLAFLLETMFGEERLVKQISRIMVSNICWQTAQICSNYIECVSRNNMNIHPWLITNMPFLIADWSKTSNFSLVQDEIVCSVLSCDCFR